MQLINDLFPAHLSKYSAKAVDEDVFVEFVITHISKNEPDQEFLDTFSEEFQSNINKCLNNPEWDNIAFSKSISNLKIKFDVMELEATLKKIKVTQKETVKDLTFKYDMTFIKKQEKDLDTHLCTYLKHKDEDDDGKKYLSQYDVEISNK